MTLKSIFLALALTSGSAAATDLRGIELLSIPTPAELKNQLGIEVTPKPWSTEADVLCTAQGGNNAQKMRCMGQPPASGTPIAAGFYMGNTSLWGHVVSTQVKIDGAGHVMRIVASFGSVFFADYLAEAVKQWGDPASTGHETDQNAFGAQVAVTEKDWHLADGSSVSMVSNYDMSHGQITLTAATR